MVYGGHLTIVPCNRDRVPTYFGDTAAVIGIASPINAAALLETLDSETVMARLPLPGTA